MKARGCETRGLPERAARDSTNEANCFFHFDVANDCLVVTCVLI